jgi:starch-binding outer membrane protein, SusD/RagB family
MNKSTIFLYLSFLFLPGCKKFIDIPLPQNQLVKAAVFSNNESANSAMAGLYSQLVSNNSLFLLNGGMTVFGGLAADELMTTAPNANADPFSINVIPATSPVISNNLWRWPYNYIYQANALIEGLASSTSISDDVQKQLTGEAKLLRALCYFYLVNLYGDVPLITSTDYLLNSSLRRTPVDEVYNQITADLEDAYSKLTPVYPSVAKGRPNKWAAGALLCRVYLYRGEWARAEAVASEIINSGMYTLEPLNNVFLLTSNETIWQLAPVLSSINTSEGNVFIPSSATVKPTYAITSLLLSAFEVSDGRKLSWLKSNTISGQPYFYPFKYKVKSSTPPTENYIVFRLAEIYLVRAEARARQNKIAEAKADLNMIRTRAGLGNTPVNDQASLFAAIEHERQVELFAEWGQRWLDLKRTNRADAVLGPLKSTWVSSSQLFPIPFSELQLNPFLIQNPGY